jgi:hypothetical protein
LLEDERLRIITSSPDWPSYSIRVGDTTLEAPGVLSL